MKNRVLLLLIVIVVYTVTSCDLPGNSKNDKKVTNIEATPLYKNIEVSISGMTCEIGCAKTIESKVSKMKGVRFSKVIFKDSIGQFTYDVNQTNAKTIINKINDIGNGKLYKVTDNKEVATFVTK